MREYKSSFLNEPSSNWIYVGGDVNRLDWSKVGMTTNGLETRHRSSQNPGYFIYAAFNIIRGDVRVIEKALLKYLVQECRLRREVHFSTGSESECFLIGPDEMMGIVEGFIESRHGSSVTYENSTHGDMSRYLCDADIRRKFQRQDFSSRLESRELGLGGYFTGNKEVYEVDLGGGIYQDLSSGEIRDRADEEDEDEYENKNEDEDEDEDENKGRRKRKRKGKDEDEEW